MRLGLSILLLVTSVGCGEMTTSGASGFKKTLEYIQLHGFPTLAQLIPGLPSQFARAEGVDTDETGNPIVPSGAASTGFSADLQLLAEEARGLSVQGFSESRRIEAAIQNFARPIHNVLGKAELFTQLAGLSVNDAQKLIDDGKATQVDSVADIFNQLIDMPRFAISTGGQAGMPSYLMLGTSLDGSSVEISGLFDATKHSLNTGFKAVLNFDADEGLKIDFSFRPSILNGLVPNWKLTSCANDLWKISAFTPTDSGGAGLTNLSVTSQECPEERNSVSTLSFGKSEAGSWQFGAAFVQNFAGASGESLRGWLGERQGFVLQAVASSDLAKVSAAAAVLKESDFSGVSQEVIDAFGVGRLLADFFTAKYWEPKRKSARSGSIFTNYNNLSYWACDAAIVSTSIQNEVSTARELCDSEPVEVEEGLSFLKSVKKNLRKSDLVPAELTTTVSALVDVLTVRNSIFLGTDSLTYKASPDDDYSTLDEQRKTGAPVITEISSTSWVDSASAELPEIGIEDLPDTAFKALTAPLKKFVNTECLDLTSDAAGRANKDPEVGNSRCY